MPNQVDVSNVVRKNVTSGNLEVNGVVLTPTYAAADFAALVAIDPALNADLMIYVRADKSTWVSNGSHWYLQHGRHVYKNVPTAVVKSGTKTAEEIFSQFHFTTASGPINGVTENTCMAKPGDIIQISEVYRKTNSPGTVDTVSRGWRVGSTGTLTDVSDPRIDYALASAASNLTFSGRNDFLIVDDTTIKKIGVTGSNGYAGTTAASAEGGSATVPSISANGLWFSTTAFLGGATDTLELRYFRLELITCGA